MAKAVTIYGIKNCDTMAKARAWLDDRRVAYAFHDYRAAGIEREQLKEWADKVGWEKLVNRSSTTFRGLADKDKQVMISTDAIYSSVAARRAGFDAMAWQVPIISLTAQAFLFTIALAPDSSFIARMMSAVLALNVTVLSLILHAKHRQADNADSEWLEKLEGKNRYIKKRQLVVHGLTWQKRRDEAQIWPGTPINLARAWQSGADATALAETRRTRRRGGRLGRALQFRHGAVAELAPSCDRHVTPSSLA